MRACIALTAPASSNAARPLHRARLGLNLRAGQRRTQPVLALGGGGGGEGAPRWRDEVTLVIPGQPAPLHCTRIGQTFLDRVLRVVEAVGFRTADGAVSDRLEDLPDSGEVQVVLLPEPRYVKQLREMEQVVNAWTAAWASSERLQKCLCELASSENPGATVTALQAEPFKDANGEEYVKFDAITVAGDTAYVGDMSIILDESSVDSMALKGFELRNALKRGTSPELTAALQGVTGVRFFLGGLGVQKGLTMQEMYNLAAAAGMSVLLLSALPMEIVGAVAPALRVAPETEQ